MEKWITPIESKTYFIHEQMANLINLNKKFNLPNDEPNFLGAMATYRRELAKIYSNDFPVANLKDSSDLIIRAIGENADHNNPMLATVTDLAGKMRDNLNKLSRSISPLMSKLPHKTTNSLPWVFNGYAKGSIMMGFSLKDMDCSHSICAESDKEFYQKVTETTQQIALVPEFIKNFKLSASIAEAITDPAMRDTVIIATHNISPTNRSGIDIIEVGSKNGYYGELTIESRKVLNQAIKKPSISHKKTGSFTGLLDSADLGKERATLRNVEEEDISVIRCVVPIELSADLKACFGERVTVKGSYDSDTNGKPRMLYVEQIKKKTNRQKKLNV